MQNDRRKRRSPAPWYRRICSTFPLILLFTALIYAYATALLYIYSHKESFASSFPTAGIGNSSIPLAVSNKSAVLAHPASNTSNEGPKVLDIKSLRIVTEQQRVFDAVKATLIRNPLHKLSQSQRDAFQFEDYFAHVQKQSQCKDLPVFISMANVFSELYWQLIENFIYTMVKFNLSDCAIMICVSDQKCIQRCAESSFPCIDFQYKQYHPRNALPSALEQIAVLKLYHIPKALNLGVNVIMLDLDVGFLSDPRNLLAVMKPKYDIYVQKDIAYVMNRTREGWRTWFTTPLPNIGIMYVKGNKKTVDMFDYAWKDYQTINKPIKDNPGKDQNKVAAAMRYAQNNYRLKWNFFPAGSAILLDMMYKYHDPRYELGGAAAHAILTMGGSNSSDRDGLKKRHIMSAKTKDVGASSNHDQVFAVHTTCYEQKSKVQGLKAANAFWNPFYYDATRRTITKPLLFITEEQLRHEIRTLLYLAYVTNRSVILPNILGNEARLTLDTYHHRALWPSFRALFIRKGVNIDIPILEPAYYYRVQRDYISGSEEDLIPRPVVVALDAAHNTANSVVKLEQLLQSPFYHMQPRLVLSIASEENVSSWYHDKSMQWAMDSVGEYQSYEEELASYGSLPKLNNERKVLQGAVKAEQLIQETRLCDGMMVFDRGNRSCFDKCD